VEAAKTATWDSRCTIKEACTRTGLGRTRVFMFRVILANLKKPSCLTNDPIDSERACLASFNVARIGDSSFLASA
jgi:hypothetical protein